MLIESQEKISMWNLLFKSHAWSSRSVRGVRSEKYKTYTHVTGFNFSSSIL